MWLRREDGRREDRRRESSTQKETELRRTERRSSDETRRKEREGEAQVSVCGSASTCLRCRKQERVRLDQKFTGSQNLFSVTVLKLQQSSTPGHQQTLFTALKSILQI